jgi:superoxide reductase
MNGIVCGTCGYVALDGKAPENCPVCNTPKSGFTELEGAINTPADADNLTELDKKHIPVVEKAEVVKAKMGEITHPMEPNHHIVWVDFYLNDKWMSRAHLTPDCNPEACVSLKTQGKISVIAFCNQHGKWIKEL